MLLGGILLALFIASLRSPLETAVQFERIAQPKTVPFGLILDALPKFGYLPLALFLVGFGFLIYRWQSKERNIAILAGIYVVIIAVFNTTRIGLTIVADRTWLFFLLMAAILAGYAAHRILLAAFEYPRFTPMVKTGIVAMTVILLILAGSVAVRQRFEEPYYHIVNDAVFEDMVWIRQNVGSDYKLGVVDLPVGIAFTPLTGKFVYAGDSFQVFDEIRIKEVPKFLAGGASDTPWMNEHGIDIVYTRLPVNNPALVKVRERVYLLPK